MHHRNLPWRAAPGGPHMDGYSVVVSELMLQQTRVDTVLDYFKRWKTRWPGWAELANAQQDEVLAQWTGLGYYNRARNLHRAAQAVVTLHGGQLPHQAEPLGALPGLGPYTVGAVRSLAFGLPAALVDGNVARVLTRWHALRADSAALVKPLWQLAQAELNAPGPARGDPASWNQALMELGATICSPKKPQCAACPVALHCQAQALGLQDSIPAVKRRAASQQVDACYAVVLSPGTPGIGDPLADLVLLGQRPDTGRWAGLWEPPGSEDADPQTLQRWTRAQGWQEVAALAPIRHVLTHRNYAVTASVWSAGDDSLRDLTALGYVAARWLPISEALGAVTGLSRLGQKLVEAALQPRYDTDNPPLPRASRSGRSPKPS